MPLNKDCISYIISENLMPRQIDVQCPKCGFVEEMQREITFFEDDESSIEPCPQCHSFGRMELPSLVNIQINPGQTPVNSRPKRPQRLSPEGVMPSDVRAAFAKELFDPCSCGQHAPADLDEHNEDCHNRLHTFMKDHKTKESLEKKERTIS